MYIALHLLVNDKVDPNSVILEKYAYRNGKGAGCRIDIFYTDIYCKSHKIELKLCKNSRYRGKYKIYLNEYSL